MREQLVDDLLARLDVFLSVDDLEADASSPAVERVLRRPWRTLEHLRTAGTDVRTDALQIYEDLAEAEERVRRDYTGRYAIELLQNAHDACADAGLIGQAWIQVTESALLIGNQGLPFDAARITALLRLGGSSKERTEGHHTIGYKGIGFSSVFEVTDEPQIISMDVQFRFHRAAAKQRVQQYLRLASRKAPIRRFPFPLDHSDWEEDAPAVNAMLDRGAVTVIRLPLRNELPAAKVRKDVRASLPPEVLLFMPALNGLAFLGDDGEEWRKTTQAKKGLGNVNRLHGPSPRAWLTASASVAVDRQLTDALDDDLWAGVTKLGVAVAMPWNRGRPDPARGPQNLHVYFPTEDTLGRPVLIHGDFYVESSRRHIEHRGAGGAISDAVARAAADLVARTAEKLVAHGNDLLCCLAPSDESAPDGYGKRLSELIDAKLREAKICRPLKDKAAQRPGSLVRLGTTLEVALEKRLALLVYPQNDVMRVGDDLDVEAWLEGLGCGRIKSADLADRLDPVKSKLTYDKAVEVVAAWYETVSNNWRAKHALQLRPLVQDSAGRWRLRDEVVVPDRRTPQLPSRLRPRVYVPPRNRRAKEFHDHVMDVPEMSPEHALELLLDAIDSGGFARDDAERLAALEFLLKLWQAHPKAFDSFTARLGSVRVPVRGAAGRKRCAWQEASSTYFSHREHPEAAAERIYGALGADEFLALEPGWTNASDDWLRLFEKLGVARDPRTVDIAGLSWSDTHEWASDDEVASARQCPDGHPQSGYSVVGKCVDRLGALLASADRNSLRALAAFLVDSGRPFGRDVEMRCGHSAHRGSRGRTTKGLQEWLLRERKWIPVREPDGSEGFRTLDEAWFDIPPGMLDSIVPKADLPDRVSAGLGLVSGGRPGRTAISATLVEVRATNPDLNAAPMGIVEAADWLTRKLDALGAGPDKMNSLPLAAVKGNIRVWSDDPVVPDVPGVEYLPIERLPPGEWAGLRASYGLRLASDRVAVSVKYEPPAGGAVPRLTQDAREQMVAVLHARGADLPLVARRLGLLREVVCSTVLLELSVDGAGAVRAERSYHLEEVRDRRRRRVGRLYLAEDFGPEDYQRIARLLTRYAEVEHLADVLTLVLAMGNGCLASMGIGVAALTEAREALARYPRAPELDELIEAPDDSDLRDGDETTERSNEAAESKSRLPATPDDTTAIADADEEGDGELDWSDAWPEGNEGTGTSRSQIGHGSPRGRATAGRGDGSFGRFRGLQSEDTEQEPLDPASLSFTRSTRSLGAAPSRRSSARADDELAEDETPPRRVPGADRDATDRDAITVFTRFAEAELGVTVKRVDKFNFGWDLELAIDGQRVLVEVKGFAGDSSSFIVTRNELRAARTAATDYRVAIVTGLRSGGGAIAIIPKFGSMFDEAQLQPMSWQVADWATVPHESHAWTRSS
jgi:hypothetical protein